MKELLKGKFRYAQNYFRPRSFILMYHRVIDLEIDPWNLAVSAKNFDEQLSVLKKSYTIVSLEDLIEKKRRGELEDNSVAITFDDGYRDNYLTAYPILRKHKVPATFFISSGYIENQHEFWPDKLIRLLINQYPLPQKELRLSLINRTWDMGLKEGDEKSRFDFFFHVWYALLQVPPSIREKAISEIEIWANYDSDSDPNNLPMNRAELVDLAQKPHVSIGAHTENHAALRFLDKNSQREEIKNSKIWLENTLNKPVRGFAYPNGSYNRDTIALIDELEFEYACTTVEMRNSRYISDYKLPRYQVCDWNKEEFTNNLAKW